MVVKRANGHQLLTEHWSGMPKSVPHVASAGADEQLSNEQSRHDLMEFAHRASPASRASACVAIAVTSDSRAEISLLS